MLGRIVRPIRQRGMGILDPTGGQGCGLTDFGVFQPQCWALANAPTAPAPPAIGVPPAPAIAVSAGGYTLAPASGAEASATVDQLIAAGVTASQAQEQAFFNTLAPLPGGMPTNWFQQNATLLLWGAGILAGMFVLSGLRR